jgi:hypothetical protein
MTEVTITQALSPRQSEALAQFDAWKDAGGEGSYQEYVAATMEAKSDGTQVTPNRAGVDVREALERAENRSKDELPGGGRRGGGRKTKTPTANAAIKAALDQFDRSIERLEDRIEDAKESVEHFDATEYIDDRTKELEQNVKQANAKLKAWKASKDEQTKQADAEKARLVERANTVEAEVVNALEEARTERDKLVQFIEQMAATA